ncbi:MAG: type II CRISPR RNA-guided endonuclease Cas9 [Lentimicrobiaceae bacterium]|jgi:CRISPR-associated endonuclease Csn1
MKKILGLDLGTNSIGWALISESEEKKEILGLGSRIIPMSQAILGEFEKGNSVSQTATRTAFRGTRRLRERSLQRRERLFRVLKIIGFLPEHFAKHINDYGNFIDNIEIKLPYSHFNEETRKWDFLFKKSYAEMLEDFRKNQPELVANDKKVPYDWTIYFLRKKALTDKIDKEELAWLLLHFNQKRGYYQLRGEDEENKEDDFQIISQKIVLVTKGEKDKKYNKYWYAVTLENDMIYNAPFYSSIENWVGQTREFILQPKTLKDGTIKPNLSFLPTFNEIDAMDATKKAKFYLKIKIKTENEIKKSNKTVGQFIYDSLLQMPAQKIKGKLVRTIERDFYKAELEQILETQIKFHFKLQDSATYRHCINTLYPLNEEYKSSISQKDFKYLFVEDILFYQRPLKSKKSEISNCPLEVRKYMDDEGKAQTQSLKCISRSHPLFQEFRIWQWMQNLKIYERTKLINGKFQTDVNVTNEFLQSEEFYVALFDFLNKRKEIDQSSLIKYLLEPQKLKGKALTTLVEKYRWNFMDDEKKSYPCNETRSQIQTRLAKVVNVPENFLTYEREIGLWHILYSVKDKEEIKSALGKYANRHGLDSVSFIGNFKKYPLIKSEYGSYSEKAIKKLLPLMRMGKYWDEKLIISNMELYQKNIKVVVDKINARENQTSKVKEKLLNLDADLLAFKGLPKDIASYLVYAKHSELSEITKWRTPADLEKYLKEFKQHSLRNPIVEQVLTETLRVVHDIWKHPKYGNKLENFFDEIHIELGREMKNNAEDRKAITENNTKNESTNLRIRAMLSEFTKPEFEIEGVRPYSPYQQDALKIFEDGVLSKYSEEELKKEKLNDVDTTAYDISRKSNPTFNEILKYKLWLEQKYRSPYTGMMIPLSKLFTTAYEIEHIIPQSVYFDDSFSNKVICESEVNSEKGRMFGYEFIKSRQIRYVDLNGGGKVSLLNTNEYEEFIKNHYSKNKAKAKKLLLEEVPEKMIERQLNDTRYISKIVKNLLSNIVREVNNDNDVTSKNIVSCNGTITSILKQDWGLHDVWNDLMIPRFDRLNQLTKTKDFTAYNKKYQKNLPTVPDSLRKGFQLKRIDHRHHAMDALVIALATRNHVNYLNNQTALSKIKTKEEKQVDRDDLKKILCYKTQPDEQGNYKWQFKKPWESITQDVRNELEKTVVSFKGNARTITKSNNFYQSYKDVSGNIRYDKNGNPTKDLVKQKGRNIAIRKSLHTPMPYGKKVYGFDVLKIADNLSKKDLILDDELKIKVIELLLQFEGKIIETQKYLKKTPLLDSENKPIFETAFKVLAAKYRKRQPISVLSNRSIQGGITTFEQMIKLINKIADFTLQRDLLKHLTDNENNIDKAFSPQGIELFNSKRRIPIYKLPIAESGSKRFRLGNNNGNNHKFVEADTGTNLYFAVYQGINKKGKQERVFETLPLNIVIERLKQGEKPALEKYFDKDQCEFDLLFTLSPYDLVYVPTQAERENRALVDMKNLSIEQVKRIYKMVSSTESECHFVPFSYSYPIINNECGTNNKSERIKQFFKDSDLMETDDKNIQKPLMIKKYCWKLKVDRLGNISI